MKTLAFLIFAFLLVAIFAQCKDDLPRDPNSFYFRCKVDGVIYIPDNCANCQQSDLIGDTTLIIRGNRGFETLGWLIKDLTTIKSISYPLNEKLRGDYKNSTIVQDRYFTDITHTGQVNITKLDKLNRLIEGTFSFNAYNAYQNKSVSVTEGVFRLKS